MIYQIHQIIDDGFHQWAVARAACNLTDASDALVAATAGMVRTAYGEEKIVQEATQILQDDILEGTFNLAHLRAAIRLGMPNPSAEGNKPVQLTTYRSQAAEMVAKLALSAAFTIRYPASPQQGAANANQPILGFDGWGLVEEEGETFVLVLIQVKGTDQPVCPPDVAHVLADECSRIPRSASEIARALSVLCSLVSEERTKKALLYMLQELGQGRLPNIFIAPAVVRGTTNCSIEDLGPLQEAAPGFEPARGRGITVSIGVALAEFGRVVMEKARAAA